MNEKIQLREGLFEKRGNESTLLAIKCQSCQQVFFPAREICLNCYSTNLMEHRLSGIGELYSFTIVHIPSKNYEAPYAIGWVKYSDGTRIFSQIRGWQESSLRTGMPMQLSIEKLWEEEDREVIGYVFRPVVEQSN